MNKKILWLVPFITALFVLTSCEFLNKKSAEKTTASERKIASVRPNQDFSKNQIPISNQPVSAMVLFKDKKPICALSAVKNRSLVPKPFKVARQNTLSFKLPKCNQQDTSLIQNITQKAVFLDENLSYQTAGAPLAIGAACLGGAALGALLGHLQNPDFDNIKDVSDGLLISMMGGSGSMFVGFMGLIGKYTFMVKGALAGLCTTGGYVIGYLATGTS